MEKEPRFTALIFGGGKEIVSFHKFLTGAVYKLLRHGLRPSTLEVPENFYFGFSGELPSVHTHFSIVGYNIRVKPVHSLTNTIRLTNYDTDDVAELTWEKCNEST